MKRKSEAISVEDDKPLQISIPPISYVYDNTVNAFTRYLSQMQKAIIFSPHQDDAILSMGSMISYLLEAGKDIDIINIFTTGSDIRSRLTEKLLTQSGFVYAWDYFQARKREDKIAIEKLGHASIKDLDYTDAAWRKKDTNPLYTETTIGQMYGTDISLKNSLAMKLKLYADQSKQTAIFAPVGRGKHTDHLLVRAACAAIFSKAIFYCDFPYSQHYKNEKTFIKKRNLTTFEWTENYYHKKAVAIFAYSSQRRSLFSNKILRLPYEKFYYPQNIFK